MIASSSTIPYQLYVVITLYMKTNILHNTECLAGLKMLPDNSIGAIITDPPYGLSFMGKKRDYDVPSVEIW